MADIIEMPKLSDTMTVGTLVTWLKKEGDAVTSGDMLAEVETDKATMELECFFDGTLVKIFVEEGTEVELGAALCAVGEPGEKVEAPAPVAKPAEPEPAAAEAAPAPASAPEPPPLPAATLLPFRLLRPNRVSGSKSPLSPKHSPPKKASILPASPAPARVRVSCEPMFSTLKRTASEAA